MVAHLEKSKGSEGFHQIIDFLSTSHIKYALTENPTIYASLIEQFWQTAALSTIEDGVMTIIATIDRNVKTRKVYSYALTKLILRVKKLERTIKTSKARRKAKIVISKDEDAEDPSKKVRSLIEELDMDVDISLVPPHDAAEQGKSVRNVQTYTRQRRRVNTANTLLSTADVSTASEMVNTVGLNVMDKEVERLKRTVQKFDRQSTDEEKGKKSDGSSKPTRKKTLARKRAVGNDSQESLKKQKLKDDSEKKELKYGS
nr:hypothetical protein [Tanacetum cinerariifolium]